MLSPTVISALPILGVSLALYLLNLPLAFPLLTLLLIAFTKAGKRLYIALRTLPRDLSFAYNYYLTLKLTKEFQNGNATVAKIFSKRAAKMPNRPLFITNEVVLTHADVEKLSNQIASAALKAGLKHGDCVAIFMTNCIWYPAIWLGLAKVGIISALINFNLRDMPLVHCIAVSECKAVIYSANLAPALAQIRDRLGEKQVTKFFQWGAGVDESLAELTKPLQPLIDAEPDTPPVYDAEPPSYTDKLLYIYTSGTTGLPKASIIPNSRFLLATIMTTKMLSLDPEVDRIYDPLPLYHTAGGIIGAGTAIVSGIPVVIREKFSASNFFPDCAKHKCTVIQYIGEMCQYLLVTPPKASDQEHNVRLMVGNGLRPNIWTQFVKRFNIKTVVEVYAATEGNANIINLDNTIGAVGFLPRTLPTAYLPVALVRTDLDTGKVLRNKTGLCDRCEVGEPGMLIGLISSRDPTREFHGYVDKKASDKKIMTDVFKKGDNWFLTGDILVMDDYGYLYFKDRTGDTFRWKGENVATAEVETAITEITGRREIAVYGVKIEGTDGRAGMAAIVDPERTLDLTDLAAGLDKMLPTYARPVFVRLVDRLEMTGTFKVKKVELVKKGFDPKDISDPLFYKKGPKYEILTQEIYDDILSGKIRV